MEKEIIGHSQYLLMLLPDLLLDSVLTKVLNWYYQWFFSQRQTWALTSPPQHTDLCIMGHTLTFENL